MLGQLLEKKRPVGATRTFPTPPYPSTHNLGTYRMSENPRDGVCNRPSSRCQEPMHLQGQPVHPLAAPKIQL